MANHRIGWVFCNAWGLIRHGLLTIEFLDGESSSKTRTHYTWPYMSVVRDNKCIPKPPWETINQAPRSFFANPISIFWSWYWIIPNAMPVWQKCICNWQGSTIYNFTLYALLLYIFLNKIQPIFWRNCVMLYVGVFKFPKCKYIEEDLSPLENIFSKPSLPFHSTIIHSFPEKKTLMILI